MRRARVLGPVGDGRLVPVMAVCDRGAGAELELVTLDRPDTRPYTAVLNVHCRIAGRAIAHGVSVVEQEDRLELGRASHAEAHRPSSAGMRPLVRQHVSLLVRRDRHRRAEPFARACDAVGTGVSCATHQ